MFSSLLLLFFKALDRILHFSDLQRQISNINLKNRNLFVIQQNNITISSQNFVPSSVFQIREVFTGPNRIPKILPALPIKWDFHTYHGKL